MIKHEWRKQEKALYLPKTKPEIINIPTLSYIVIEGEGHPGSDGFQKAVEALYACAYGIRMAPKQKIDMKGYFDYTVYPLEGFWDFTEEGRKLYQKGVPAKELKDHFKFRLMIRQPDFVNEVICKEIQQRQLKKKKNYLINNVSFDTIDEGLVCQMMHIGSYDEEPQSFQLMMDYCEKEGYERTSKIHKEVYIGDPRRMEPDKLKTVIRFPVKKV